MDWKQFVLQQYDGVVIADSTGAIEEFLVGHNSFLFEGTILHTIQELEMRVFEKAIFSLIEEKEKQSFLQKTKTGLQIITKVLTYETKYIYTYSKVENYSNRKNKLYKPISADFPFIVNSPEMYEVYEKLRKTATTGVTVLLLGESGVGKEMAARTIHLSGMRKKGPFVAINCGAIPENLIENELFGHVEGAYTGASKGGSIGKFRQADQGILFLDEIGELPLPMQVKLLRVLQERTVTPIGSQKAYPIDVQIVSATNQNLTKLVQEGKFREDLFYRLNIVPIQIPALRNRVQEIPDLIHHFVTKFNHKYNLNVVFTDDAVDYLCIQDWPGNVRELENSIERLVVLTETEIITSREILEILNIEKKPTKINHFFSQVLPLKDAFDLVEKELIEMAMTRYKSPKLAADMLGISQPTMSRKLQKIRQQEQLPVKTKRAVLEEELDKRLRSIAIVTAVTIPLKLVQQAIEDEKCKATELLTKKLTDIKRLEGIIHWVYVFKMSKEGNLVHVSACDDFVMEIGEAYLGPTEVMNAANDAFKGNVSITSVYEDRYGSWKTCFAPLITDEGDVKAIIGYDYSQSYITAELKRLGKQLNVVV
ncbi:sigma-54 interaction domain-containing protein [Rummeliibacillus pycnus]|uniref:sigma-54 interaction domain-containing protein n=1 Tax=Rummeliibacillus pycnus TaxID=101070 RepID=UPI000C99DC76|nr:sigma 54-interacting transcriptional regulator [Rummeliibacillus pycnus]